MRSDAPPVYLDYNATTPVDPAVLEAMLPFLRDQFGNPSSAYSLGRKAKDAIENARAQVANLIGALPDEIVFTSGGTEATNIAIRGAAALDPARTAIVTTAIEHPATDECCLLLERQGHMVRRLAPAPDGCVVAAAAAGAIGRDTALVSVIHAQNEIGTLQPVAELARLARTAGAKMHADAAQSLGKVPVDVGDLGVDFLTIAGHKLYAPKGIGALYVKRGVTLPSVLVGAGQEHGRRPGTENVSGIVALGEACRLAAIALARGAAETMRSRAQALLALLRQEIPGLTLTGDSGQRLPNTLNVLFPGVSGRILLQHCPGVFASTGSACHADREEPSSILAALGIPRAQALGAVRLSVGRTTTEAEIETGARRLAAAWHELNREPAARRA